VSEVPRRARAGRAPKYGPPVPIAWRLQLTSRVRSLTPTLMFLVVASTGITSARDLTLEERIHAQEAVERVYYSHQEGTTRPFEEAVPRAVLERKVRTMLEQSSALEAIWNKPVTAEALQRETERIARGTRMPERLRELYAALGNDAFLFQETVARAALVDRLARSSFAADQKIHARASARAAALRRDLLAGRIDPNSAHPARSTAVIRRSTSNREPSTDRLLGSRARAGIRTRAFARGVRRAGESTPGAGGRNRSFARAGGRVFDRRRAREGSEHDSNRHLPCPQEGLGRLVAARPAQDRESLSADGGHGWRAPARSWWPAGSGRNRDETRASTTLGTPNPSMTSRMGDTTMWRCGRAV